MSRQQLLDPLIGSERLLGCTCGDRAAAPMSQASSGEHAGSEPAPDPGPGSYPRIDEPLVGAPFRVTFPSGAERWWRLGQRCHLPRRVALGTLSTNPPRRVDFSSPRDRLPTCCHGCYSSSARSALVCRGPRGDSSAGRFGTHAVRELAPERRGGAALNAMTSTKPNMADCGIAVSAVIENRSARCVARRRRRFTGDGRYVDGCCGCVQLGQSPVVAVLTARAWAGVASRDMIGRPAPAAHSISASSAARLRAWTQIVPANPAGGRSAPTPADESRWLAEDATSWGARPPPRPATGLEMPIDLSTADGRAGAAQDDSRRSSSASSLEASRRACGGASSDAVMPCGQPGLPARAGSVSESLRRWGRPGHHDAQDMIHQVVQPFSGPAAQLPPPSRRGRPQHLGRQVLDRSPPAPVGDA